jgi:hypothetical protein
MPRRDDAERSFKTRIQKNRSVQPDGAQRIGQNI